MFLFIFLYLKVQTVSKCKIIILVLLLFSCLKKLETSFHVVNIFAFKKVVLRSKELFPLQNRSIISCLTKYNASYKDCMVYIVRKLKISKLLGICPNLHLILILPVLKITTRHHIPSNPVPKNGDPMSRI